MDPPYKLNVVSLCFELNNKAQNQPIGQPGFVSSEKVRHIVEDKLKMIWEKITDLFKVYAKKLNTVPIKQSEISASFIEQDDMVCVMLSQRREASI